MISRTAAIGIVALLVGVSVALAQPPAQDADKQRDEAAAETARLREQIVHDMQAAEKKLKTPNAGMETQQLQDRAIRNIDRLIDMLRNPPPTPPQPNSESQPPKGDKSQQPQPQPGQPLPKSGSSQTRRERRQQQQSQGNQPTPQPIRSSSNQNPGQLPQSGMKPSDTAAGADKMADMSKGVWGHLPESLRQEVDHYYRDRFMPRYRDLLQEYYKRLAEQDRGARRDR